MFIRDTICEAIGKKRLLQFRYAGYVRVVEPHLLGYDTAEHDVLSAYLVRGEFFAKVVYERTQAAIL